MKIHYRSLSKQLDAAIRDADEASRPIDYIELSLGEWHILQHELADQTNYSLFGVMKSTYRGVVIKRAA